MCMKNYNAEKIIFDKFTAFFNFAIFFTIAHIQQWLVVNSLLNQLLLEISLFVFLFLCRFVPDNADVYEELYAVMLIFDKSTASLT